MTERTSSLKGSLVSSIYCGYQPWLAQPKNSDRMKEQEETILDARSTKTFITRNPVMRTKGKVKQMTKVTIPTTKEVLILLFL